jgi:hypothetical protein
MNAQRVRLSRGTGLVGAVLAIASLFAAQATSAQAWLPAKGTFGLSLTFSDELNLYHYLPDGEEVDAGHTRSDALGLSLGYSPTDRLLLTASIPYVMTRYWGDRPHPGEVDNGDEHRSWTDLRVAAHYQLLREPFALAPYIAFVTPVSDYPTLGHAAPGRGLNETWLGFGIGKSLAQWIPRTYVQGRYNYAFVEEVADIAHDNSNVDLEIGHFINRQWSVRALCFMRFAHGGVDVPMPRSNPLFPYHDQLAATSFTNLGVGASYSPTQNLSFYVMGLQSVRGKNGHKVDQGLTLGMSYGFSTLRERVQGISP